jgi:hypothetical protein
MQIKSNSDKLTEPLADAANGATVPSLIVTVKAESTPFTLSVAV